MYYFLLRLRAKQPNERFDMKTPQRWAEIHEVVREFNTRFLGKRQLAISEVAPQELTIILGLAEEPKRAGRLLGPFSRMLFHTRSWKEMCVNPDMPNLFYVTSEKLLTVADFEVLAQEALIGSESVIQTIEKDKENYIEKLKHVAKEVAKLNDVGHINEAIELLNKCLGILENKRELLAKLNNL
jgi:hypothetical protein